MNIFKRIFFNALIAGITIGLLLSLIQTLVVFPFIAESEKYENLAIHHEDPDDYHSEIYHTAETYSIAEHTKILKEKESQLHELEQQQEWFPEQGFERTFYTTLSNVFLSIAISLLITIGFTLQPLKHWSNGIYWGLAGLLSFYLT